MDPQSLVVCSKIPGCLAAALVVPRACLVSPGAPEEAGECPQARWVGRVVH